MPANEINTMGAEAFANLKEETPIEHDRNLNNYVTCISNAIIQISNSDIPQWEVAVFQDDTANAFALPGGKIGVHTGLLPIADNASRLATVIGHEIGHVLAQHGNERVSQEFAVQQGLALIQALANVQTETGQMVMGLLGVGAQFGVILPFSRIQESEADMLGLQLMAKAGFDPRESVSLWQNMARAGGDQPPEFLSTHPSHETRIVDLNNAMSNAMQLVSQAQANGIHPNCHL
jgi:predicted Zn-dependent protease